MKHMDPSLGGQNFPGKVEPSNNKCFSKSRVLIGGIVAIIVVIMILFTVLDVWVSCIKHLSVGVNDAQVMFENSVSSSERYQQVYDKGGIVAFVNINYDLKSRLHHNVGISSLECDIFGSDSSQISPLKILTVSGTEMEVNVVNTENGNGIRQSKIDIILDEIAFTYIRKCILSNCGLQSLKAICKVKILFNLYGYIPIAATLPFTQSMPLNLRENSYDQEQSDRDFVESFHVPDNSDAAPDTTYATFNRTSPKSSMSFNPKSSSPPFDNKPLMETKDIYNLQLLQTNMNSILYKLDLFLPKTSINSGSYLTMGNIIFHIPTLSYQMGFVNTSTDFKWEVSSTAFELDIVNGGNTTVFLSITCTSEYSGEACSLISPLSSLIESIYRNDMTFTVVTEQKNFIVASIGSMHYMNYQSVKTTTDTKTNIKSNSESQQFPILSTEICSNFNVDDIMSMMHCSGESETYFASITQNDLNILANANLSYQFSHDIFYLEFKTSVNDWGYGYAVIDYQNDILKISTILKSMPQSSIAKYVGLSDFSLEYTHNVVSKSQFDGKMSLTMEDTNKHWYYSTTLTVSGIIKQQPQQQQVSNNFFQLDVVIADSSLSAPVTIAILSTDTRGRHWNVSVSNVKLPVGCVYGWCVLGNVLAGRVHVSLSPDYTIGHVDMAVYDMDSISRLNVQLGSSWEFRDENVMIALLINGVKDSKEYIRLHTCLGSQSIGMYRNIAGQIHISQNKSHPVDYDNVFSTSSLALCSTTTTTSSSSMMMSSPLYHVDTSSHMIAMNYNVSINTNRNFPYWEILLNHIDGKVLDYYFSTKNAQIWTAHSRGNGVITVNSNIKSQWRRCKSPYVKDCGGWHNGSVDVSLDWMNKDNSPLAWSLRSNRFSIEINPSYRSSSRIRISPKVNISMDLSGLSHGHVLIDVRDLNFLGGYVFIDNNWDFRTAVSPSTLPSSMPSVFPTTRPSAPTTKPTPVPTVSPSTFPTARPSAPSLIPSQAPSTVPSSSPSVFPTTRPTAPPTSRPNPVPSTTPTVSPSPLPSIRPSASPSSRLPTQGKLIIM
eukprot:gene10437-21780_t